MKNLFLLMFLMMITTVACNQKSGSTQQGGNAQQQAVAPQGGEGAQQGGGQRGGGQGRNMGTPEERAKAQTDRLVDLLTLTADQKTKIETIEVELQKQMDTRRQNAQGDMEAFRAIMQEIETAREAKYKDVLTADQLKKYTENRNQRRQGGPGQGQGGRPPGQGQGGGQRQN